MPRFSLCLNESSTLLMVIKLDNPGLVGDVSSKLWVNPSKLH